MVKCFSHRHSADGLRKHHHKAFQTLFLLKEKIESAYLIWRGEEILWYDESDETTWAEGVRYYGTFRDVAALYIPRSGGEPFSEKEGGGISQDIFLFDEEGKRVCI